MNKTYWPIEKLKNWDENPREISREKFIDLKESLKEDGQLIPLLVDIRPEKYGTVLGGNMTLKALKELGINKVWVEEKIPRNDAHAVSLALKHNMKYGSYQEDSLAELIEKYKFDLDLEKIDVDLGEPISLTDLLKKFGPEPIEDEAPELAEGEPVSKYGEVYQLGNHRLMCGDSAKPENISKLLGGDKPVLLFTDPPYGVDYLSRQPKKTWGKIKNDNLDEPEMLKLLKDSLSAYLENAYVCCNWKCYTDFETALGMPKNLIVWDKGSIGLGWGYRYQHEFVLFYGKIKKVGNETDLWRIKRDPTINYIHPTQKPVGLSARAVQNSSNIGDVILDLFGGSGSTLIACEQLGRYCYMMELDPRYCDVIRKRYARFIGREAEWQTITGQK